MVDSIRQALADPDALEELYRRNPGAFSKNFEAAAGGEDFPGKPFWQARLRKETPTGSFPSFWTVALLALAAGTLTRLPALFPLEPWDFYTRYLSFALFPALAAYFLLRTPSRPGVWTALAGFSGALAGAFLLPSQGDHDTVVLALLHLPLLLWTITGLVYLVPEVPDPKKRLEFLLITGETAVYTGLILAAGVLLTGLAAALLSLMDYSLGEGGFWWIAGYGGTAAPLAALHLVMNRDERPPLLPLLAKIFTPLLAAVLVFYLGLMVFQGRSPFQDRDFLLVFNILLFVVMVLGTAGIGTREAEGKPGGGDIFTLALLILGLLVDLTALSAIGMRMGAYGWSPNRAALLGANGLILVHLGGAAFYFARFLMGKAPLEKTTGFLTSYLPAYMVWTALMVFIFPLTRFL